MTWGLKPVFEKLTCWAEEHAGTLHPVEVDEQEDDEEGEGVQKF